MEVLAGARSDAPEEDFRRLPLRFGLAHFDAVTDFEAATTIHRRCRKAGVTPRGMVECHPLVIEEVALGSIRQTGRGPGSSVDPAGRPGASVGSSRARLSLSARVTVAAGAAGLSADQSTGTASAAKSALTTSSPGSS